MRRYLLPLTVGAMLAGAGLSLVVGGTSSLVLGAGALTAAVLVFAFGRPRRAGWLGLSLIVGAALAVCVCVVLRDLTPLQRIDRAVLSISFALFFYGIEIAPSFPSIRALRTAVDFGLALLMVFLLIGPVIAAGAEGAAGRLVSNMYHVGVPDNSFVRVALQHSLGAPSFNERNQRLFASGFLFDTVHAARFDDPHHVAKVALQPLPWRFDPCTFQGNPPQSGYVSPGYGKFITQVMRSCNKPQ